MKLSAFLLGLALLGLTALVGLSERPSVHQGAIAPPTAADFMMETAEAAIEASLAMFPPDTTAYGVIARLMSYSSVRGWKEIVTSDWGDTSPAWVVAIRGDGLVVADFTGFMFESKDVRPVIAGYWVWDANGGQLVTIGGLESEGDLSRLSEKVNELIPIVPATYPPPVPTTDPATIP